MVCILSKQAPFHSSALRDCAPAGPCRHGPHTPAGIPARTFARRKPRSDARRAWRAELCSAPRTPGISACAGYAALFCPRHAPALHTPCMQLPARPNANARPMPLFPCPAIRQRRIHSALFRPRHAYPPACALRASSAPGSASLRTRPCALCVRPCGLLCTEKNKGSPQ